MRMAMDALSQETLLLAVALGVVLVSTPRLSQPLWRMASAVVGRLYLSALIVVSASSTDDETNEEADQVKVSGLFVHPGTYGGTDA